MFTDYEKYEVKNKSEALTTSYKIKPGDELSVKLYTRDGSKLIENTTETLSQNRQNQTFLVDFDGNVVLPIVGEIHVKGKTEKEIEASLEKFLEKYYNRPYTIVKVMNRRAFVFIGESSFMVELNRSPTNIFEVISKTGNFDRHASVKDILIFRNNDTTIHQIDLSSITSINQSNIIIEPNDVVYIREQNRKLYHAFRDVSPVVTLPLSIITSTVSVIVLILSLSR